MSFALLKNSNCCTIIVINDQGTALLARGAIGAGAVVTGNAEATLQKVSQVGPAHEPCRHRHTKCLPVHTAG